MAHQPKDLDLTCAIPMATPNPIGIISQAAELPLSTEISTASPLLDEWIKMARCLVDLAGCGYL